MKDYNIFEKLFFVAGLAAFIGAFIYAYAYLNGETTDNGWFARFALSAGCFAVLAVSRRLAKRKDETVVTEHDELSVSEGRLFINGVNTNFKITVFGNVSHIKATPEKAEA